MRENLEQRAEELAVYIIENRATIRAAAKHFGVSKSTVHKVLAFLGSFPYIIYREAGNPKFSRQSVPAAATVRPPVFPLDANRFSGLKKFFQKTA